MVSLFFFLAVSSLSIILHPSSIIHLLHQKMLLTILTIMTILMAVDFVEFVEIVDNVDILTSEMLKFETGIQEE